MTPDDSKLYRTTEFARACGCSTKHLYDLARRGVVSPQTAPDGTRLWPQASVEVVNAHRAAQRRRPNGAGMP